MPRFTALIAVSLSLLAVPVRAQTPDYPVTKAGTQTDVYHGKTIADPYRWLEDDNATDTKAWVEAQNRVSFDYLQKIPFRDKVTARYKALVNYPKYSAPFKKNEYVYFYKNDGLQNQSILYVQKGYDGTPEVLIDPNTFSPDGTIRLTSFTLSKNGKYAVVGRTAISGSDWQRFQIMDMETRTYLPETVDWVRFGGASWRGDGFYYSRYPKPDVGKELTAKAQSPQVFYHKLNTPVETDTLVYEDKANPNRYFGMGVTEDERFAQLYISESGKRGNALFFRDESKGVSAPFVPIVEAIGDDSFGIVDNEGDKFLIQTNRNAPNEKVVLYDPAKGDLRSTTTVLPEQKEPLQGVSTAGGKLIASYLKDVTTRVAVYDRVGKKENEIALPGVGTASGFGGEKGDTEVFFSFAAMNIPASVYRYDLMGKKYTLFRAPEIPGYNPDDYESKQVFYKSKDGTRIPMFLLYKKGTKLDGTNPTLLYGYGGFNISLTPSFSTSDILWCEMGGVFAKANLRGGSEYGEKWHEAGYRDKKQNVFDDCIAAAEYLIKEKYTSPAKLAIRGGSNGGLLVGAVINQRPDLFRAAVPEVGVMDMLRYQKFSAGTFWVSEYGSSDDPKQFQTLIKYSPLHNMKTGVTYPTTLITTSDHDDRVVPAHSFKYAATLQKNAAKTRPVLIRIGTNSGHSASNLSKSIEKEADVLSFLLYNLGVTL
ncbi:MAG: S9 family peptidase [Armatimonadetes bacterium]|nr:S9 family peptidase [Armatimonadota bacterium]